MGIDQLPRKTTKVFIQRDVRRTPASTQTQSQTNVAPLGAIFPWLKSFTNTPALISGWVECNGQVLSDGDSVYNGQTLPDLNGDNRFLRGAGTSGGTGGTETHSHKLATAASEDYTEVADSHITEAISGKMIGADTTGAVAFAGMLTPDTNAKGTLPTYYEVVWIMRIK